MLEEAKMILEDAKEGMESSLEHLDKEFLKIRTGKANPSMLLGVKAEFYGTLTPIEQMANINTPDPRQIVVQPWDKSTLHTIEKAILNSNLGFNPQNDGEIIRIAVPPLTTERRRDLVKKAKGEGEDTKVGIRNIRRSANDMAKGLKDEGYSEDMVSNLESDIQELTDKYIKKVDELFAEKEIDITTI
ncbi:MULTISPECIES: ribosome recycling factor [unclassified Lentimicrobium]|uniref:ribosome recycling factor n=1 Tax=unclassified Lentimicrobium TaxID=2677434 RepID=UPI0015529710|nr:MULTISPECIES: ribosome recycling factor [unclassified Lentimicrobium]NPD44875.1 ribosome recycling factor [Lentimicrobium sp. S6]NPD83701.1 ribosome recycling factor [Lentimicrobium sp. L6]